MDINELKKIIRDRLLKSAQKDNIGIVKPISEKTYRAPIIKDDSGKKKYKKYQPGQHFNDKVDAAEHVADDYINYIKPRKKLKHGRSSK